jgi:hypothetical protein
MAGEEKQGTNLGSGETLEKGFTTIAQRHRKRELNPSG